MREKKDAERIYTMTDTRSDTFQHDTEILTLFMAAHHRVFLK